MKYGELKRKIEKAMDKYDVRVNNISIGGVTENGVEVNITKVILSLDCPEDHEVAKVLSAREYLDDQHIHLGTVLLEL